MSDSGLVIVIGLIAFLGGVALAVRLWPAPPAGRAGALVLWASRLVAGAALAAVSLDIYAVAKRQSGPDLETDPVDLADGLTRALYDAGVLFSLSVGLALIGVLLAARERSVSADPQ